MPRKTLFFLLDPDPSPRFKIILTTLFVFLSLSSGFAQSVAGDGDTTDLSLGGLSEPLQFYSFNPDLRVALIFAVISSVLGILFFLVQTALGSVSKITDMDDTPRQDYWNPGNIDPGMASRLFERRCWCCGVFSHLLFLIAATSLILDQKLGAVPLQVAVFVPLILVFQFLLFDLIARQAAIRYSDLVLKWLGRVAWIISFPLHPLFVFLHRFPQGKESDELVLAKQKLFTREREFRLLPHISHVDQVVEEQAVELMDSVREFMESSAGDIMTPRTEIEGIEIGATREEIISVLHNTGFSRIVVYRGNLDHIEGFLLAKEVMLNQDKDPMDFLRRPVVAESTTRLSDLLRLLKGKKTYLAVVADEYGGTSGIITLQDLFMAVMGDRLEDLGHQHSLWIEQESTGGYLLSGRVETWEANQEMGTELDDKVARTIGGYIMHLQGRLPETGEILDDQTGSFEVIKIENNRVEVVRFVPRLKDSKPSMTETSGEVEN